MTHVVAVSAHLIPRDGSACSGFTFEIARGTADECCEMARRVGGAYSDWNKIDFAVASVVSVENWNRFLDAHS